MATEDVLERYARMLRDQNWSDLARQQVMDEMAAELRLLQKDRERLGWLLDQIIGFPVIAGRPTPKFDRATLDAARAAQREG